MTPAAVTLYVTDWCPYCQRAKNLLAQKNVVFSEKNVDDQPEFREEMMLRLEGHWYEPMQDYVAVVGGFVPVSVLVAKLGAELYAQHHIGKLDDDDHD